MINGRFSSFAKNGRTRRKGDTQVFLNILHRLSEACRVLDRTDEIEMGGECEGVAAEET